MQSSETAPLVAIACGGTGGHLFPGLAVAGLLVGSGCAVQLLISSKEVDREGVRSAPGMQVIPLPAIGLKRGNPAGFLLGLWKSHRVVRSEFHRRCPAAVLAMGGFTSVAPIWVARSRRIPAFVHESNSIPGRANRWLATRVDQVFVGFPSAARQLHGRHITHTGTPVRPAIRATDPAACRRSLGFDPDRPLLLVVGGSQGAGAINDLLVSSLRLLRSRLPGLQFLHLTGPRDFEKVREAYRSLEMAAVVRPFFAEMETALGGATAAVSRAGASSLAEFAAARLPAVLIPYPAAADNHQFFNARALVESGAALMLEQSRATSELLAAAIAEVVSSPGRRESICSALSQWDHPDAAQKIVTRILSTIRERGGSATSFVRVPEHPSSESGNAARSADQPLAVA